MLSLAISLVARAGELSFAGLRFVILCSSPSFSALITANTTANPSPHWSLGRHILMRSPSHIEISSKQMTIFAKDLS